MNCEEKMRSENQREQNPRKTNSRIENRMLGQRELNSDWVGSLNDFDWSDLKRCMA
jgi:hypothetical protein